MEWYDDILNQRDRLRGAAGRWRNQVYMYGVHGVHGLYWCSIFPCVCRFPWVQTPLTPGGAPRGRCAQGVGMPSDACHSPVQVVTKV